MPISSDPVRALANDEIQAVNAAIAAADPSEAEYLFDDLSVVANASAADASSTIRLIAFMFTRSVGRMGRRPSEAELIDFSHLSDEEVDVLSSLLPKLQHDEAVARIADVLWLRTRDCSFANQAADAYLRLAESSANGEHWPHCVERFERAVVLAASLNRGGGISARLAISRIFIAR